MSLIEKAAQRLEELRRAGIEVPVDGKDEVYKDLDSHQKANKVLIALPDPSLERGGSGNSQNATSIAKAANRLGNYFELDLARLAARGFVTPDIQRSRIADEFRILKRPLIGNISAKKAVPIKHANLVMVTSSVPGEGKTFCAVNLAMSLATELDKTVLLVDADVARPALPAILGLPPAQGLLDVLENKGIRLGDVLLRTNVEKLTVLPSGTPHPHATELLASSSMAQLLEELSARYPDRIIVFDSPPLLVTTESRVLASQMGQIAFVVHAESTLQADVKRALATIESCPVKLLVLNQARTVGQGAHGYGYGYGYGA